MAADLSALPAVAVEFLTERHLATLTTLRADGTLHVVPVGFTVDRETGTARVICSGDSVKARNAARLGAEAALCQVDGRHWMTLSGPIRVDASPEAVADAEHRYAERYKTPRINPQRVVLIMDVTKVIGSRGLT